MPGTHPQVCISRTRAKHEQERSVTKAEQETIIRYAADAAVASIFTAHPPTKRKLERGGYRPVRVSTMQGTETGWFYRIPITELRWRVGARQKRQLTEAQRQVAVARLRGARA